MTKNHFDWADSIFKIAIADSDNIYDLAKAASLSPENGDLSDIDLSNLDLRGQNFSGWDLRYANFQGALIENADFSNAKIDYENLSKARDWDKYNLARDLDADFAFEHACSILLADADLPARIISTAERHGIFSIGDIVSKPISTIDDIFEMDYDFPSLESFLKKNGFFRSTYKKIGSKDFDEKYTYDCDHDRHENNKIHQTIAYVMQNEETEQKNKK